MPVRFPSGRSCAGEFNDYIRVTGQVQPITTVQLSPLEAGIVERLVVEEGTSVKKGDVLVVLSNTSLTLEILNSEPSWPKSRTSCAIR